MDAGSGKTLAGSGNLPEAACRKRLLGRNRHNFFKNPNLFEKVQKIHLSGGVSKIPAGRPGDVLRQPRGHPNAPPKTRGMVYPGGGVGFDCWSTSFIGG